MKYARIRADLKVTPLFTCTGCGIGKFGDQMTVPVDVMDACDIDHILSRIHQRPAYMPVGWSNGDKGFRCARCTIR